MHSDYEIQSVHPEDYPEITDVWEASVRATHDFLTEEDIGFLRPLVLNEYLDAVDLSCVRDNKGRIIGFLGVDGNNIEMLFIDPACRGQSVGRRLLEHAIRSLNCTRVDVNEQNGQAMGFYRHLGFEEIGRSPLDGQGRPFPLLHMRLAKR